MHTSTERLLELMRWLSETAKSATEMYERFDGRTIASAERRGYMMLYSTATGTFVMITDRGEAFVTLEGKL